MIKKDLQSVARMPMAIPGADKVEMQVLCGPEDGCPTFAMRRFILGPGGYTPRHYHDFEHEVLVTAGEGIVFGNGREEKIKAGDVLYVPANEVHQFRNASAEGGPALEFICLVPAFVHKPGAPMPVAVDCAVNMPGAGA
jgi:quercetin dioxygenase-like cupin family protein